MKKLVFCLMAAIAVMSVGCKKQDPQPEPTPTPVVEDTYKYLGRGYNAAAHYAMDVDVKAPVLSQSLMESYGYVDIPRRPLKMSAYNTFGKNLEEYEKNMSEKFSVGGSIWGFTASLRESFSDHAISNKENAYYTSRYSKEMVSYSVLSNATVDKLMYCLHDDFKDDVESGMYSASQLVDMYGTHVILGFSMGGRLEFSISAMNEDNFTETDFSLLASAGYNGTVGSISDSVEYNKYKKFKSESHNFSERFYCRGGNSSEIAFTGDGASRRATYNDWDKSLEDETKQVLVEFDKKRGIVPLSEFISDATLAEQVEAEIKNRLNKAMEQDDSYRSLRVYFKRVDAQNAYNAGFPSWTITMSLKQDGTDNSCYLYNTQTTDVTIPGGNLKGGLPLDGQNGTYQGINFKRKITGTEHKVDIQKLAVENGEPASKVFKLNRWDNNTIKIQLTNIVQRLQMPGVGIIVYEYVPTTVEMKCPAGADVWKFYRGNDEFDVPDRTKSTQIGDEYDPTEMIIISNSTTYPKNFIKLILEYEWE